ncbi:hypothetical protein ACIOFV_50205 [Streptomyces mirabilis]|uniref:hypothetical protein n=1 Tax=Streptomyces mirabilis TaxID=68239 RepID=UPI0038002229
MHDEGWTYDSLYPTASGFVQDICDSLPTEEPDEASRSQWLKESGNLNGDRAAILQFGVPKLCPKWTRTLNQALGGDYAVSINLGKYKVTAHPKPYKAGADVQEVAPGTYRATGQFSGCYWERTSPSGTVVANQYVTQATVLTVTLKVGELFKNECGTFTPVG